MLFIEGGPAFFKSPDTAPEPDYDEIEIRSLAELVCEEEERRDCLAVTTMIRELLIPHTPIEAVQLVIDRSTTETGIETRYHLEYVEHVL